MRHFNMNSIFSQPLTSWFLRLIALGLALALLAALPRAGQSAPEATTRYVAPGGSDGNNCLTSATACEHIQAAINKSASGDTIVIAAGTYKEKLFITDKSLTLLGEGSATTMVDGSNQERVLFLTDDDTSTPMTVVVSGLSLRNGRSALGGAINNETETILLAVSNSEIANNTATATGGGGGIFNQGSLKLTNVVIRDNIASSGFGGGIYNLGETELSNTTLANNIAAAGGGGIRNSNIMTISASLVGLNNRSNGSNGGGIYNVGTSSKLTLINSTVSGNVATAAVGGGIYNENILISSGTLISGNVSTQQGGGLYNAASGQVILTGGGLRGNESQSAAGGAFFNAGIANLAGVSLTSNRAGTSGGGVHNTGSMSINANTISINTATGQPGGGIYNQGVLTVTNTALISNTASVAQGGGLHNTGTGAAAELTNVTVSNNTASTGGGGIQNISGTLAIKFSTISNNSAPALNRSSGSVTVGNSILAQDVGNACGGTITSVGYNIDKGNSCGFSGTQDLTNTDPELGPLQDNGGNSPTRAIAFSSPAVDSAAVCPPPATDQRGMGRPQGNACDRGAYEVVGYFNSNPLDIGPNQCVTSTMNIPDQFAIGRMLAGVNLAYPNRANLTIRLLSPGVPKVNLLGPAANSGQNLDTMFDDSAPNPVPTGNQNTAAPFYDNIYKPATPLSQVRGTAIKGTWKLQICNTASATGTLNRWVLIVPEVSDFKVYLPLIRR
jgi:subtilisin-like proprotein convertase family protein